MPGQGSPLTSRSRDPQVVYDADDQVALGRAREGRIGCPSDGAAIESSEKAEDREENQRVPGLGELGPADENQRQA